MNNAIAAMREQSRQIIHAQRQSQRDRAKLMRRIQRGGAKHPSGATKSKPSREQRRAKAKRGRKAARR